jgi:hypothetical protein
MLFACWLDATSRLTIVWCGPRCSGLKAKNVVVTNLTQNAESVSLRFRLQENCIETSGFGTLAAGSDPGRLLRACWLPFCAFLTLGVGVDAATPLTLEQMADLIRAMLADPDSAIYRGLITSSLDPDSLVVEDPNGGDDAWPWWYWAAGAGGAAALIGGITMAVCMCRGGKCRAGSGSSSSSKVTSVPSVFLRVCWVLGRPSVFAHSLMDALQKGKSVDVQLSGIVSSPSAASLLSPSSGGAASPSYQ